MHGAELPQAVHVGEMEIVKRLRTRNEVAGLVEHIAQQQLPYPAVVVTRPSHRAESFFPVDELAAAVDGTADVYMVEDSDMIRDAIRKLGDTIPAAIRDAMSVYGGAARVFPAGQWDEAPLFFARSEEEGHLRVAHIAGRIRRLRDNRGSLAYSTTTGNHDAVHEMSASLRAVTLQARVTELEAELKQERRRADRAVEASRVSRKSAAPLPGPKPRSARMFADAADEIRHRVLMLWAEQTTPAQKLEQPLPEYAFAPSFAGSVETVTRNDTGLLDKIARCALKVLLGQERDSHKLDPNGVARAEDGAVCWRAYVEQNAPSARRLHYWKIPGGRIEFSRVVLHDDYRP